MAELEAERGKQAAMRRVPPVGLLLQALADAPDDDWRQRAACHPDNRDRSEADWTAIWFPENGAGYQTARRICEGCPVQSECEQDGADEAFGMWGATTVEDRALARNPNMPPMTRHGYPFGAQAHRRRGEKPCEECMNVQRQHDLAYRAKRKAAA